MEDNGTTGPLKGIRVLDWTMWQFGPVSTSMMGDMGADVVKIESLEGDAGRTLSSAARTKTELWGDRNAYFETCNRNKRSISVNLRTDDGREIVHRLVKDADVFVQNFRKGVAERLMLDYDTLREINPMLIYGSASGYGPEGPDAFAPSFDGCGQARGGLMIAATPASLDEPSWVQGGVSDQVGAIHLCLGVLSALVARSVQGTGQKIDASHLSSVMWLQGLAISMDMMQGRWRPAYDRMKAGNPLVNQYKCKDGSWMMMMMLQADRYWPRFATVLGIEDLIEDPRFATMRDRSANNLDLINIIDERMATRPYAEWDAAFREAGDFIYAKVQHLSELQHDPQVIANNYITDFDHPTLGPIKMAGHPITYSETPAGIWREAPELGQHTEEVLLEVGYHWPDIERFRDAGAIL